MDINPKLEIGDRVILIVMSDPYSPITVGTKGTVTGIGKDPWSIEPLYYVEWDNGSTLNLIGDEDVWVKDDKGEILKESFSGLELNACNTLTNGREFCNKLSKILSTGRGGTNAKNIKEYAINVFREIMNNDFPSFGKRITLSGNTEAFTSRVEELEKFYNILDEYGVCKKMKNEVKRDIQNVEGKGLKMIVDDDENYSVLNRIDTHYTVRSYILTKMVLDEELDIDIDTLDTKDVIEQIRQSLFFTGDKTSFDSDTLNYLDRVINNLLSNEETKSVIINDLERTRSAGNKVESDAVEAFKKANYEVIDFTNDFGFVDHFGIDMVVIRDGKLRPVQVSSRQKENPMFFKYQDTDCDCMAVYKGRNGRWRVDTLLSENKEGLINVLSSNDIDPSEMDDLLSQLPDEEVTDLAVRNLERKFLKSGNPRTNARKYLEKLVNSVKNREDIEDEDDDYDVEDEFVYGGEEPEKSSIGKKRFKRELLPLQAELLKLQEHIKETGKSIAVVFEGRDTAGKGSTIRTITKYLDPKYFNVVALGIPTPEERKNWFGRYEKFIEPGKITFFDRSWYNRGIVEPVMGYGEEGDYEEFLNTVNDFEKSLVSKGVDLYKFWLSITPKTQEKRFDLRKSSPLKYWKYSPNDEKSLEKWDDYTEYKQRVFDLSKGEVPWTVVDTNDKRIGSLNLLRHILKNSDYPDKNEGTIGDTYPESITTINENFIDDMKPLLPILQSDDSGHIFNFLIALRDSGIVNMMQSPDFTWSGRDFLDKYLKIQELQDSYQQIEDEDEKENLLQLAEKSQQVMISAALRNLQDKEQELSTNNINRELRKLGPLALRYFMMKL
jgi:polyphosphate kinase 2